MIDEYNSANSSYRQRGNKQKRINKIVDLLMERDESGDPLAVQFFDEAAKW